MTTTIKPRCTESGCHRMDYRRGLCHVHYAHALEHVPGFRVRDPKADRPSYPPFCRCSRVVLERWWQVVQCSHCGLPVMGTCSEERQARARVRWPRFMALIADQVIVDPDCQETAA
jgi:hypothetical protein